MNEEEKHENYPGNSKANQEVQLFSSDIEKLNFFFNYSGEVRNYQPVFSLSSFCFPVFHPPTV
jgi:uncharacterized membrane protein